jgi:ABC-type arginine transport system permease subunit
LLFFVALGFGVVFTNLWFVNGLPEIPILLLTFYSGSSSVSSTVSGTISATELHELPQMASPSISMRCHARTGGEGRRS